MDGNTSLLLALTGERTRWEDQERGNYDVDQLREEFRRRLYADASRTTAPPPNDDKKPTEAM